jgi:hypothetical protein
MRSGVVEGPPRERRWSARSTSGFGGGPLPHSGAE